MSKDYELDLFQNMIDSLDESIEYYKKAIEDESKYKFCIILLTHFMELSLKHLVEQQNPILCYERPYSEKLQKEKTITWGQALQILINCKINIDNTIYDHFYELTSLRNNIIHFKFSYNTELIRNLVVNIVSDIRSVFSIAKVEDFYLKTKNETKNMLDEIKDEYQRELHLAQANALETACGNDVLDCNICGEERTVNDDNGVLHCNFCHEDDRIVECSGCCEEILESVAVDCGENDYGETVYLCEYCDRKFYEDT